MWTVGGAWTQETTVIRTSFGAASGFWRFCWFLCLLVSVLFCDCESPDRKWCRLQKTPVTRTASSCGLFKYLDLMSGSTPAADSGSVFSSRTLCSQDHLLSSSPTFTRIKTHLSVTATQVKHSWPSSWVTHTDTEAIIATHKNQYRGGGSGVALGSCRSVKDLDKNTRVCCWAELIMLLV